jgi:glycine/D-amino acid oxidase-like deaminating enzyme
MPSSHKERPTLPFDPKATPWRPAPRPSTIARAKTETFDLVVIGGGCVGTGIAVDALSRGLSVALVERDDFAAGTSSRSTKLIHGGVRYATAPFLQRVFVTFGQVPRAGVQEHGFVAH